MPADLVIGKTVSILPLETSVPRRAHRADDHVRHHHNDNQD